MKYGRDLLWAIAGVWDDGKPFLYTGTWLTRKDAIAAHVAAKGRTWKQCRKDDDRAVKVTLTWKLS